MTTKPVDSAFSADTRAERAAHFHKEALRVEAMSSMWLNRGREAEDRGNKARAEACYEKAGHYLDRANELRGLA